MKLTIRIALLCIIAVVGLSAAITKNFGQPIVTVPGVYENLPSVRTLAILKVCES
jgi:hypothetical protein